MSGVAAMCFGFYLIYDTELIVGGKVKNILFL